MWFKDDSFIVSVPEVDTTKQLTVNCSGKDIEIDAVNFKTSVDALNASVLTPETTTGKVREFLRIQLDPVWHASLDS